MIIQRDRYLKKLIERKENRLVKVITGIRRCGKSVLLNTIYHDYLLDSGVKESQIIMLALDQDINAKYRNPLILGEYIRKIASQSDEMHYVFLDEIQKVAEIKNPYLESNEEKITFVDTLLGLMAIKNIDLYVTGSNSKMLSSDILTAFRGRGDEIRMNPLSYSEFYSQYGEDKRHAWRDYFTYGGMPFVLSRRSHEDKAKYLSDLFSKIYITDVVERNRILNDRTTLEDLLDFTASAIGSFTNPTRLERTFLSLKKQKISHVTISRYLEYLEDAFILSKAKRFDIKGRKYIGSPMKYYFTDIGLRNARLGFRQMEETHIMENVIYNELMLRGYSVDVGNLEAFEKDADNKTIRKQLEVDFVANDGLRVYYIQSALSIDDETKRNQETRPFRKIPDSFRKIVIVKDDVIPWHDNAGVLYLGIEQFLLDEDSIRL
ncbi:MAG: ATP-binding protein [Sphaerochaeta sp.]|nr:ATP-binding protein [Sphaerochaeta sp.]